MGIVPNLVTAVWVGAEDRSTHFASTSYGQGATMALPVWGIFMKKCYAQEDLGISDKAFKRPKDLSIETNCEKWAKENAPSDTVPNEFDF